MARFGKPTSTWKGLPRSQPIESASVSKKQMSDTAADTSPNDANHEQWNQDGFDPTQAVERRGPTAVTQ
jgi:hypothetical protein